MIHLALYQPAIPQNTGSIARTCVGLNAHLHVIGPLRFEISDRTVQRAGLDYWPHLTLTLHDTPDDFLAWLATPDESLARARRVWPVTKFASQRYDQAAFADEDVLLMGNENTGLPDDWRTRWPDTCIAIPMLGEVRSYNLANAASIVLAQASSAVGLFDSFE